MQYSYDLRLKVVKYVEEGASKAEAARRFGVSRRTVTYWFSRENLQPTKTSTRQRKINKDILIQYVKDNPSSKLCEYAEHFGVSINSIWCAFKRLGIVKKTDALSGNNVYETH